MIVDESVICLEPKTVIMDGEKNKFYTKTAKLLEMVCGDTSLVRDFDSKRHKLKLFPNSSMYRADYGRVIALLEINILNMYHDKKQKLKNLEQEAFLESSSSLNIALNNSNDYAHLVEELKILQIIRTELQF